MKLINRKILKKIKRTLAEIVNEKNTVEIVITVYSKEIVLKLDLSPFSNLDNNENNTLLKKKKEKEKDKKKDKEKDSKEKIVTAVSAKSATDMKTNIAPAKTRETVKATAVPAKITKATKTTAASVKPAETTKVNVVPVKATETTKASVVPAKATETAKTNAAVLKVPSTINKNDNNNICVISGKEYCIKIIALYRSLMNQSTTFNLWVLCTDDFTFTTLSQLNLINVELLHVKDLEDDSLRKVKQERKINEYCWTLKAPLIEYILLNNAIDKLLYCDGDLYFFQDPTAIFQEWEDSSIYLCPQRDLAWVEQKYGQYQAGVIGFKNDETGLAAVKWWKDRCIEWCSAVEDNGRFGDQKYLDQLPIMFKNVKVSSHLGINTAPWNCIYNNNFQITKKEDVVYIQDQPLIAYHFSCLTIYDTDKFDLWNMHQLRIQKEIIQYIYRPYLNHLKATILALKESYPELIEHTLSKKPVTEAKTLYYDTPLRREMDRYDYFMNFATIFSKEYLIKGLALYDSIKNQMNNFHMWICTMDQETHDILNKINLKNVTILPVSQIENPQLLALKEERTLQEYCWTMKGVFIDYILTNFAEINHLFYCDSDLYFFSNPTTILKQWEQYSIFLCRQRGSAELEHFHGQYQAGFIGFKNDNNSRKILNWWKNRCIENCSSEFSSLKNTWGDQKYLDRIPELFKNIKVSMNPGINAAPWNLVMYNKDQTIEKIGGKIFIEDNLLIFYHFGSLVMKTEADYDLWKLEPLSFKEPVLTTIYAPYLHKLKESAQLIKTTTGQQDISSFLAPIPANYELKNPYSINS